MDAGGHPAYSARRAEPTACFWEMTVTARLRLLLCSVGILLCLAASASAGQPAVRLADVLQDGTAAPQAWNDHVAYIAAHLIERAESPQSPIDQVDRHLDAANWILSYTIEPMASRRLLDIAEDGDAAAALTNVAEAKRQLDAAAHQLDELVQAGRLESDEQWSRMNTLSGLSAFVAAFESIWQERDSDEARREAISDAAYGLAVVLEDRRKDVALTARLWQAYLNAQIGKLARATELLPEAMSKPEKPMGVGTYARILRCRYSAGPEGGYPVAIALLARLEERCLQWFRDDPRAYPAQRAAALVRRQVLGDWEKLLQDAGHPDRAEWCADAIKRIDHVYFDTETPATVLRLEFAAPPMVDLDAAEVAAMGRTATAPSTEPATEPATQPSTQPNHGEIE